MFSGFVFRFRNYSFRKKYDVLKTLPIPPAMREAYVSRRDWSISFFSERS